ncbi:MAG: chemotaxis protein [Xanthobacteraceae bacterium]|nr:chemotaxis protein [Xanthobacteraceae bacterium]
MSLDEWKKDEQGQITVNPLASFELMIAAQNAIGVKLDYLNPGDLMAAPSGILQIALTPRLAKQLGQALLDAAGQIMQVPAGKPS